MAKKNVSDVGKKLLCEAIREMLNAGGSMPFRVLREKFENHPEITAEARETYDSNKNDAKWVVAIHSWADRFDKAGFLTRNAGVWGVTPAGESALEDGDDSITQEARKKSNAIYKQKEKGKSQTKKAQPASPWTDEERIQELAKDLPFKAEFNDSSSAAVENIRNYINSRSANADYSERLVKALLHALGYESELTQKSHDGGVDVIATNSSPLVTSRIFVQVKNQKDDVAVEKVRALAGVLTDKKDEDTGLFVSFSGFRRGCWKFASASKKYIRLVDCYQFIKLWCENYGKLSEADKKLLPLQPIYFLDEEAIEIEGFKRDIAVENALAEHGPVNITSAGFLPEDADVNDVAIRGEVTLKIGKRTIPDTKKVVTNPTYLDIARFANDVVTEALAECEALNKKEGAIRYGVDHRFLEFVDSNGDIFMGS